jgi:hypothetical protein
VKSFKAEAPLPEKISGVMATLQTICLTVRFCYGAVFLPKPADAVDRMIVIGAAGSDTPIVQTGMESIYPPLKSAPCSMNSRFFCPLLLESVIEKDAKVKARSTIKTVEAGIQTICKAHFVAPAAANKTQVNSFLGGQS